MSVANQGAPAVPPFLTDEKEHRRKLAQTVNSILAGKVNCTSDVTLSAGVTTTTVNDARISYFNAMIPSALTSTAAADVAAGIWVSGQKQGQCVLHHRNDAATDRTLRLVIIG